MIYTCVLYLPSVLSGSYSQWLLFALFERIGACMSLEFIIFIEHYKIGQMVVVTNDEHTLELVSW